MYKWLMPEVAGRRCTSWAGALILMLLSLATLGAGPAGAKTLNVCPSGCPYTQIAPALAAAKSGDTIRIAHGTYAGGLTIDVSVKLAGAGPRSTIISGGGPVVTIGSYGSPKEPTVSIDGVTITGGRTRSSPESTPFVGKEGVFAVGGGVEIPPNADFTGGATVSITDSVITGNRVAPTRSVPSGIPCPTGECPFAFAGGGGIDSWGTLTLADTTVSDNRVGSASHLSTVASDADGGAIMNWLGPLTIRDTDISDNEVSATGSNGRFAESGAIQVAGGTFRMSNSSVKNNSAVLKASLPNSVDLLAVAGGIHLTDQVPKATITNSTIADNSVSMTNSVGYSSAFSGGIHVDLGVDFRMSDSVVAHNSVSSATVGYSSGNADGDSGAGEMLGTISHSRFTGNTVRVSSAHGDATGLAGAAIFLGTITNSVINGNHLQVSSPHGTVALNGGALVVDEEGMTLRHSTVHGNTADASGLGGKARGGGIFDAAIPNGPPGGPLILTNSRVTGNVLNGSAGITLLGGGLFVTKPVTVTHSVIAGNSPDQCSGC